MSLYAGIDLHSNNCYIGIIDASEKRVFGKRIKNDKKSIKQLFDNFKTDLKGIAVESTYNWYWLVDLLMEEGYKLHLANPAAMKQYSGIKYLNDSHDAFWLAKMLKLGILPEGYIYPKEKRGIRDLLRQRSRLVCYNKKIRRTKLF